MSSSSFRAATFVAVATLSAHTALADRSQPGYPPAVQYGDGIWSAIVASFVSFAIMGLAFLNNTNPKVRAIKIAVFGGDEIKALSSGGATPANGAPLIGGKVSPSEPFSAAADDHARYGTSPALSS